MTIWGILALGIGSIAIVLLLLTCYLAIRLHFSDDRYDQNQDDAEL